MFCCFPLHVTPSDLENSAYLITNISHKYFGRLNINKSLYPIAGLCWTSTFWWFLSPQSASLQRFFHTSPVFIILIRQKLDYFCFYASECSRFSVNNWFYKIVNVNVNVLMFFLKPHHKMVVQSRHGRTDGHSGPSYVKNAPLGWKGKTFSQPHLRDFSDWSR